MSLQLLSDYVSGHLDDLEECRRISRMLIIGNSISHEVVNKEQHYKVATRLCHCSCQTANLLPIFYPQLITMWLDVFIFQAKYLTKNTVAGTVEAVKEFSSYLQKLTKTIHVTVMPGENDPANSMLPQQPLHPCMFDDKSGVLETATNPYICDVDGIRYFSNLISCYSHCLASSMLCCSYGMSLLPLLFQLRLMSCYCRLLGHSGQPVNNIRSYSKLTGSVDIMKKCLTWCHMAPTAPDTLR